MTDVIVCVDVGSTYTKAAAVDADSGALLGTASHPTTLGTDVITVRSFGTQPLTPTHSCCPINI